TSGSTPSESNFGEPVHAFGAIGSVRSHVTATAPASVATRMSYLPAGSAPPPAPPSVIRGPLSPTHVISAPTRFLELHANGVAMAASTSTRRNTVPTRITPLKPVA